MSLYSRPNLPLGYPCGLNNSFHMNFYVRAVYSFSIAKDAANGFKEFFEETYLAKLRAVKLFEKLFLRIETVSPNGGMVNLCYIIEPLSDITFDYYMEKHRAIEVELLQYINDQKAKGKIINAIVVYGECEADRMKKNVAMKNAQ